MTLSEKDLLYNWHPYTQHKIVGQLPVIIKGNGIYLTDDQGKIYIDAISSWWTSVFGHCHPQLIAAATEQLNTLEHVLFGGFSHVKAIELSEKLISILPNNQKKIFYSDNGSTAVEVALKAAFQYFINQGQKRSKVLAFEEAFHGDTFGAMASSGISLFSEQFNDLLLEVTRIPLPNDENIDDLLLEVERLFTSENYACFIFEPLIQGAAGMRFYDAKYIDQIIALCKNHQVLTIADEIMTGFGKTGRTFASDYLVNKPDMMCLSKALTGGVMPMAVTSFSQEIYAAFFDNDINKALFHGHTFTANPLGCAIALASIKLYESDFIQSQLQMISNSHQKFVEELQIHPLVKNPRTMGPILAFEVVAENDGYYGNLRNKLYAFFIDNGFIIRPVGNTIYILPPYVSTHEELEKIYAVLRRVLLTIN
jgi:adenosylmethionine---8-amino-7-oxononanoate aminotransferase